MSKTTFTPTFTQWQASVRSAFEQGLAFEAAGALSIV